MGDPKGFLKTARETPRRRPVDVRLTDWREVYEPFAAERTERQAARCMDCGIPFCHSGCPLGNLIPEWNDLVYRADWALAADRLHATNNFPEFTGRLCPAPCETACVLGINAEPVTIKQVEVEIIDRAWADGGVLPLPPSSLTGHTVAVVGSGPAGLAAAQQLTRAGHQVTVFEADDLPGGLLRYGIPEFKMEKSHLDRRIDQMTAEGTAFSCGVPITSTAQLDGFSAVVLAGGARVARELPAPGRELAGIHQAMEYLPLANRLGPDSPITAAGKHVVIIGGGDTGADCLGTALRQGALSVTQLEIMPKPPKTRAVGQPWPTRRSTGSPPPTRRAASASTPSPPRSSSAMKPARSPRSRSPRWSSRAAGSPRSSRPAARYPVSWCCWRWASPDPSSRGCLRISGWSSTRAATWPATTATRRRSPACSWPATWAAASR